MVLTSILALHGTVLSFAHCALAICPALSCSNTQNLFQRIILVLRNVKSSSRILSCHSGFKGSVTLQGDSFVSFSLHCLRHDLYITFLCSNLYEVVEQALSE
jgi:hypothetical protein